MTFLAKHQKAIDMALTSLAIFLGVTFIFLGSTSLTPVISKDYHRQIKINYQSFAKSLPFTAKFIDRASLSLYMRYVFAVLEITLGLGLAVGPALFKQVSNFGLLALSLVTLLLGVRSGQSSEQVAGTFIFSVLLVTRLVLVHQSGKKSKLARSKAATSAGGKTQKPQSTPRKTKAE